MRRPIVMPEPEPEPPPPRRRTLGGSAPSALLATRSAPPEGVPPREPAAGDAAGDDYDDEDDAPLAYQPSLEVRSLTLSGQRLLLNGPESVRVRLAKGDPLLSCSAESDGASHQTLSVGERLYRMGISSLRVQDNSGLGSLVYSHCIEFEVHGAPQRDRKFFFEDGARNRWEQRADRADTYSLMFNSDNPRIVSVTRTGGPDVRWEVAKDAAGTVWEPFDAADQAVLNAAYQSDESEITIKVGTEEACLVDLRAEEVRLPTARGGKCTSTPTAT